MGDEKGFTIKDKRSFDEQGNPLAAEQTVNRTASAGESSAAAKNKPPRTDEKAPGKHADSAPEINFASFVLSLSTSVLYHFGEVPDPITNKKQRNLMLAKQTIDILGILKEKTAGNLAREEESLLTNLLYDLRMRYVKEIEQDKTE
jgi:hypothetical protein